MRDVDKSFLIVQYLLESINKEVQGKCFYKESVDELLDAMHILEDTLRVCQVGNKK